MSTVSTSRPPGPPPDEPDPFRYGWRYVRVDEPDGTVSFDQVPLTLEDVLFPEEGDVIVQTDLHDEDVHYLKNVFKSRLVSKPRTTVLSDCGVDWNLPGLKPLCPDVAVFFDIDRHGDVAVLDVAAEGAEPALVTEVTSPSTRVNDVERKFDYYYQARVPIYVIADVIREENDNRQLIVTGYRHTPAGYQKMPVDARGYIWLEPVGLWLGVKHDPVFGCDRLACYDPVTGEEVGDYTTLSRELAEKKEALAVEMEAREAAERRAADEAKAREAAERRASDEAEARETAERRAAAEIGARTQAEARIRELEAAMQRLTQRP